MPQEVAHDQHAKETRSRFVKHMVSKMSEHHLVQVRGLTKRLENALYTSVVRCLYDACYEQLGTLEFQVQGHVVQVHVQILPLTPLSEYTWVDTDPGFFRTLVDKYMDQNSELHVRFLPRRFERRVYANLLGVCLGVLDIVCQSTKICFLGHAFTVNVRSLMREQLRESLLRARTTSTCPQEASKSLQNIIERHVTENRIRFVPRRLHRWFLYHALKVVRALAAEIIETSSVDILDRRLQTTFRPTDKA